MPHIASVLKKNFCSGPAMPVPLESTNHHFTVGYIGCNRMLRLFPVGLFEVWTINALKIDRFAAAVVTNSQSIALMDGDDSRDKVSP